MRQTTQPTKKAYILCYTCFSARFLSLYLYKFTKKPNLLCIHTKKDAF